MTIGELLARAERALAEGDVPEARANAEWLLAEVLGCSRPELRLRAESGVSPGAERRFLDLVAERRRRTPLAYVLGRQQFLGLELRVTPAVLIPRPETEELVRAAADRLAAVAKPRVLEIGTGSGCIAIGLASLSPRAELVATDASADALALARENAARYGLAERIRFVQEDLFHPAGVVPDGWADLVVSNPPYIASAELPGLQPEVLREPPLALDGGPDGLAAIRAIVERATRTLAPDGRIALELAMGQAAAVAALLRQAGFSTEILRDAQGLDRIAVGCRNPPPRGGAQCGGQSRSH